MTQARACPLLPLLLIAACSSERAPELSVRRSALDQARALVGLDEVAARGFDGSGVTVAVIDSGIDATHPDLAGALVDEACFCSSGVNGCCPGGTLEAHGPGSALDDNGHGTHVAGIIASRGTQSPRGGAPGSQLVAVKVLSGTLGFCCMADVVAALDWVASNHPEVKVINLSLGTASLIAGDCDVLYSSLASALDTLRANGVLVIAASGNDGSSTSMASPACVASALSVGAVWDADVGPQSTYCTEVATAPDQIGCYSNASSTLDLLAPGGVIESTWRGGGTQSHIGTSHSAPIVSACAATLLQADPSLSADALEPLLESTGRVLVDPRNGMSYPRLDCAAALAVRVPLPPEDDAGATSEDDAGAVPEDDAGSEPSAADAGGSSGGSAGSGGQSGSDSPPVTGMDASLPVADAGSAGRDGGDQRDAMDPGAARGDGAAEAGGPHAQDGGRVAVVVAVRGGGCSCEVRGATKRDGGHMPLAAFALLVALLVAPRRRFAAARYQSAGRSARLRLRTLRSAAATSQPRGCGQHQA